MIIYRNKLWKPVLLFISISVIITEILLSFFGPMATLDKMTVIVSPIYNSIDDNEMFIEELTKIIESHIVKTGSFTIVKQSRFQDYYYKHPEELKDYQPYKDYLKIAGDAGIEKLLTVSLYGSENSGYSIHLTLRDTERDLTMKWLSFDFQSLENLDRTDMIIEAFSFAAKRISMFDLFFMFLLLLQLIITIYIVMDKKYLTLLESAIVLNIVLFLFSYFFARNANMDYFQKFVATRGQVTIAQNTTTEQMYALIRFLPLFLINLILYIKHKYTNLHDYSLPLTILSSVLYSLIFPNQLVLKGIPILAYISLVPLFIVLIRNNFSRRMFYGTTFGLLQAILINFWQGTYSFIGLQLVTVGLLLEYLLFMLVLNAIIKISGQWKLIIIPLLWCFFEYTRSIGYIGYPWGLIGTSQFSFTPLIQLASITGVWGLSLLVLYINSAICWLITMKPEKKKQLIFPSVILMLTIINISWGYLRISGIIREENLAQKDLTVIVVQQNRDPRKHSYQQSLEFAIETTNKAIVELGEKPDLVVWSEGAFKPDIKWYMEQSRSKSKNAKLVQQLITFAESTGSYLVTGTQDHIFFTEGDKEIRRNFNSSALLNPDGTVNDIYHKMKLVPFTEHFPYKKQLPVVWEFLQKFDTSNWLAGDERKVMDAGGLKLFTPICFEDAFPDHIRRYVLNGGELIANISNDYWSLSPVEGMQHGINGLFRSVENRRPMVRATCSGYTVYADSTGRIQGEVEEFYEKGYVIARIKDIKRPMTFYTKSGDWLPFTTLIILVLFGLSRIIVFIRQRLLRSGKP